jgi:hypothetical protein
VPQICFQTRNTVKWLDFLGRTSNPFDHNHLRIFVPRIMVSKKRSLEGAASPKAKKSKLATDGSSDKKEKRVKAKIGKPLEHTFNVAPEEIDFPRGGGTTFTAQEVKAIRAEAMKEADDLFKVRMRFPVSISSCLHGG